MNLFLVLQYLGELVLAFLNKDVQPCCQLTCLETVRILTRDKNCLSPFVSRSALSTLARFAGILTPAATRGTPTGTRGKGCHGVAVQPPALLGWVCIGGDTSSQILCPVFMLKYNKK